LSHALGGLASPVLGTGFDNLFDEFLEARPRVRHKLDLSLLLCFHECASKMPAQPLSSVKRNARILVDPGVLRSRPQLAVLIADIISLWGHIEGNLGAIFVRLLGASARPGAAIYHSLGAGTRQNALRAVARLNLDEHQFKIFEIFLKLVSRGRTQRDRLAHWLWALSPEIEDALLLIDPDAVISHQTNISEYLAKLPEHARWISADDVPPLNAANIFVYKENDFHEIIYELNSVWTLTTTLTGSIANVVLGGPELWSLLEHAPQIRKELEGSNHQ
jgi:hypothetical protein